MVSSSFYLASYLLLLSIFGSKQLPKVVKALTMLLKTLVLAVLSSLALLASTSPLHKTMLTQDITKKGLTTEGESHLELISLVLKHGS